MPKALKKTVDIHLKIWKKWQIVVDFSQRNYSRRIL